MTYKDYKLWPIESKLGRFYNKVVNKLILSEEGNLDFESERISLTREMESSFPRFSSWAKEALRDKESDAYKILLLEPAFIDLLDGESSNGRTTVSETVNLGSKPSSPAEEEYIW